MADRPRVLLISVLETRDTHRVLKESTALESDHDVDFLGRGEFPGGKIARLARSMLWLTREARRYHAFHVHELWSLVYVPLILLFRRPSARIVYEEREYALMNLGAAYSLRTKLNIVLLYVLLRSWVKWFFDAVIVISDEMSRTVWRGRADVVWNYPDFTFVDSVEPNGRLDPRFTWIVHHGVLVPEKGVLALPELVARLGRDDVRALVIGDFAEHGLEGPFRELTERFGVTDRFVRPGRLPFGETIAWLKNDVRLVAAILAREAGEMSRTVFVKAYEYLYLGIPLVASDHIKDFVENIAKNGAGVAVPASDPAAHAAAVRGVLDDLGRFRAACAAARDRFSWATEAQKLRAIYERIGVRAG